MKPASLRPCATAPICRASRWLPLSKPINAIIGCCARAANGHVAAVEPPAATVCPALRRDRVLLERAADPLHRARINSKLFGNDADTRPPRSRQSLTDSLFQCGGDWGTPKAFTLAPGARKASTDSFLNHRPLKLGKHAHHLKHRLPGRCRGVEPLLAQE